MLDQLELQRSGDERKSKQGLRRMTWSAQIASKDKGIGMTICSSDATFALPLALSLKKRKEIVKLKKEWKRVGGTPGE